MQYPHPYNLEEGLSISVNPPEDPYPLPLNISLEIDSQWTNYRLNTTTCDEQFSPQHSSHFPTAPPSPVTPNSLKQYPSPYIPFDELNIGVNTTATSPHDLGQSSELLSGLDLSTAPFFDNYFIEPTDKFGPSVDPSYGYPPALMDQLHEIGSLQSLDGVGPDDIMLFGGSSLPATLTDSNPYPITLPISQDAYPVSTSVPVNYPNQSLLQVPPHIPSRRHSDNPVESITEFRSHVKGASSLSSINPRDTLGQSDDYVIAVPEHPVGRSKSYNGHSTAHSGITRKSHSLRGRNSTHSRASSRNSSNGRPSPYPSTAPLPEHPEHDDTSFPSPPSPHCVQLRQDLLDILDHHKLGNELTKEESDHVEQQLRLHSEHILNFQPLVHSAEPTAVTLAAHRRRRASNKNENRKMFTCFLCARELTEKHNFVRHFLAHYGIKRFRCDACGEGSTTSSDLTRHKSKCEKVLNSGAIL